MYSLALSRLSLSTHPRYSTTSELTETLNQYALRLDALTNMSERMVTSFTSLVSPPEGEHLTQVLIQDGLILSMLNLKTRFCRQFVSKLRGIGCFRSTESFSTQNMPIRPRSLHTNLPPRLRLGGALHDYEWLSQAAIGRHVGERYGAISSGGRPECRRLTPSVGGFSSDLPSGGSISLIKLT